MNIRRLRKYSLLLLIMSLALGVFTSAPAAAQCTPDTTDCFPPPIRPCEFGCGGVSTNPEWLKIDHHRVSVEIADQIARTHIDLEFDNDGNGLAEGTFIFPLPAGASVDSLTMYINGVPIEARILEADEARAYYDEIVRQYRDPALLEYIGMGAIQANVFPIPPGESRRIELSYSQPVEVDNGLIHYVYPLDVTRLTTRRPIEEMSISVSVESDDDISVVYSPSHDITIARGNDDRSFRAGFERNNFSADQDFSLYYGIDNQQISTNLLTYRDSAGEDGFFMLLVQPPLAVPDESRRSRDLIIVLDQSGSMDGDKWEQAQDAAQYVLGELREGDRFNVVLFSTGWRIFSRQMESAGSADEASTWIDGQYAEGGTDIDGSLTTAIEMADPERATTILFLTDGLPTEGETNPDDIFAHLTDVAGERAGSSIRLFAFGVGDDVDTFLLDRLTRDFGGTSTYVRPTERIDEEVASLWNKVSSPVLENVELTIDGVTVDSLYPQQPLPDLYAGTQFTLVGRFRGDSDNARITLTGDINGERETFVYDNFSFRERAGGEGFIARLWATRRIGELLNRIRLDGEDSELVDSIVSLSVRYGIITPYTSFLIDENDILTQSGRAAARDSMMESAEILAGQSSGAGAVGAADAAANFAQAAAPMAMPTQGFRGMLDDGTPVTENENPIQTVGGKTFLLQDGVWTDTTFLPDTMTTQPVVFLSDEYFTLVADMPELASYFALGERVIVVIDEVAYEVVAETTAP